MTNTSFNRSILEEMRQYDIPMSGSEAFPIRERGPKKSSITALLWRPLEREVVILYVCNICKVRPVPLGLNSSNFDQQELCRGGTFSIV